VAGARRRHGTVVPDGGAVASGVSGGALVAVGSSVTTTIVGLVVVGSGVVVATGGSEVGDGLSGCAVGLTVVGDGDSGGGL